MQNTEQTAQSMKAKTYIPGETKAERKARKRNEKASSTKKQNANKGSRPRAESITHVSAPAPQPVNPTQKSAPIVKQSTNPIGNYVVCLKYGTKYNASYVNKLYNMVSKNLTIEHEFVCFTEDPTGIDERIRVESLNLMSGVSGWWYKPMFFSPTLPLKGTILFLDLDMIIFRNIDNLFTHDPGNFYIIRDFNRYAIANYNKFNSSVFRLNTGQHTEVWTNFINNASSIMRRYHGDQDWIRVCITQNFNYWPDEWIQSYKWEMRGKPKFNNMPRGQRDFAVNRDPTIKDNTAIAVFHGDPNPHNCRDQWVLDNWN